MRIFTRLGCTMCLLTLSQAAVAASQKNEFQFQVREVGAPDELHLYAKCGFNKASVECHVDSGMKQTEYNDEKFFKKLSLVRAAESKDAFGKASKCSEYKISSFKLDSSEENDFLVKRCEGKRLHQAVVGIDFLRGKKFELNFDRKTVDFSVESIVEGEQLLLLVDGYIGLPAAIGKSNFIGLFDTGVGKTVVDEALVTKNKDAFELIEQSEVSTPTGGKFKVGLYRARNFVVAGKEYAGLLVQAMPFSAMTERFGSDVHAIIGNNIIMQDNWHLDLVNRRFRRAPSKFLSTSLPVREH